MSLLKDRRDEAIIQQESMKRDKKRNEVFSTREKEIEKYIKGGNPIITVGKWKGKYAPREKYQLEKMFDCRDLRYKLNKRKLDVSIPKTTQQSTKRPVTTDFFIVNEDCKTDQRKSITGNSIRKNTNNQVHIKSCRKTIRYDLNGRTPCFTNNHNRFCQKRFKMNPRFTWICKSGDDQYNWIDEINKGITNNHNSSCNLRRPKKMNLHYYRRNKMNNNNTKEFEASNYSDNQSLNFLNLSDIAMDSNCNTIDQRKGTNTKLNCGNSNISSKYIRKRIVKKVKVLSSMYSSIKSTGPIFDLKESVQPYENYFKSADRLQKNLSYKKATRQYKSKPLNKSYGINVKLRNTSGNQNNKSNLEGNSIFNQIAEIKKKEKRVYEDEIIEQRKLINQKVLHNKDIIQIKNNPIFDLEIASRKDLVKSII